MLLVSITNELPKGFEIVIEPSPVSNPTKKLPSALNVIVESSRCNSYDFNLKFSYSEVNEFLIMLENAPSKRQFLKSLPSAKKPSHTDQVEVVLVSFLKKSCLGYQVGSGGQEEKANNAKSLVITLLSFVHEYCDTFACLKLSRFKASVLLAELESVKRTKVNQGRKPSHSKAKLQSQVQKAMKCVSAWSSNYYHKSKATGDCNGEAILS